MEKGERIHDCSLQTLGPAWDRAQPKFWQRPGLGTLTFYQAMFVRALLRCAAYEIIAWYSCVRSSVRSLINLFRPGVQSILLLSFRHVTILTGSLKIGELPTNRYRVSAVGKRGARCKDLFVFYRLTDQHLQN